MYLYIVTYDVGVSLHSKTHPLFMKCAITQVQSVGHTCTQACSLYFFPIPVYMSPRRIFHLLVSTLFYLLLLSQKLYTVDLCLVKLRNVWDRYRNQIVTCNIGVSLHSKTHPLFTKCAVWQKCKVSDVPVPKLVPCAFSPFPLCPLSFIYLYPPFFTCFQTILFTFLASESCTQ